MRIPRLCLFFFVFLGFSKNSTGASRYWVSLLPNNWSNTIGWSLTSGGAGGASVPGVNDIAIFDGGPLNLRQGNCTINMAVMVAGITVSGYTGTLSQGANSISVSGAATFESGTFSGGSASITITGVYTLAGTAFTSTSATLELQNNAAFTSGSFLHNNGRVRFNTSISPETISGTGPAFYTLEFVGSGHDYTISSAGNISVASNLIISGTGFINLYTGTIDVKGDINITNTAPGCGGDATINVNGTGTQNFNGNTTAGAGALPKLTINKASGTLNLTNFPGVSNNFTYTAGTVNAGTSFFCFTHGNAAAYSITGSLSLAGIEFIANTSLTTFTIGSTTTLTATGDLSIAGAGGLIINTGNINVSGNIFLTNTAINGGGTATINITGTGNETLDGTAIIINQSRLPAININKAGGTLTLSGNISASANVTYVAGTVSAGTSTLYVVNSLTITGNINLYNLTIANTGTTTVTIAAGSTVTATHTLDLENGANNITINTGTIAVQGNIIDNNSNITGGGTGTILINGSGAQTITSTGIVDQGKFPSVTINKSGGTLTFPSLITVTGNWTYTAGTLDVSTNNSTIVFAGTLGIAGSHTLNNVTFEGNNNSTFTVNTGTLLTVTGTLSTTGIKNVFINSPVAGATAIQAQGDIIINNTSLTGGGTALLLINGAGSQALTGNAPASQGLLPYIRIQKASGTLTMSGIISVARDWTWLSGTVAAGNSSLVFGGNNLSVTSGGMSFYNVAVTTNTCTLLSNLTVLNNLAITGTAILSPVANTINLGGNWTDWGTGGFAEASGTVNFNGSSLQTITSPAGENYTNLIVNNTGSGIQLGNAVAVASGLTMTQGNIDLHSNTLTLGTSALAPGTLNYTAGIMNNTGSFTRWFAKSTITAGGMAGLFPVGTTTDYRPFSISVPTAPTTGGTITVSYTNAVSNTSTSFADGGATVVVRKDLNWAVTTATLAGGLYNAGISGTGYGLIGNPADLRLTLAAGVTGLPGTNAGTILNPQVNRTGITQANLNNSFYLGSINSTSSPLPVTLVSFTAIPKNSQVNLDWTTSAEINNDYFIIQRSPDAEHWQDLQRIPGSGNTGTDSRYSAIDPNPLTGISYYRLDQTDLDGKQSFSMIRKVSFQTTTSVNVYPNPATNIAYVSGTGKLQVSLYSSGGQFVNVPLQINGNTVSLNIAGLPAGIYYIHIQEAGGSSIRVLVKE